MIWPRHARTCPKGADARLESIAEITSAVAAARSAELDGSVWFESDFRFMQALELPGLRFLIKLADTGVAIFTHPDGSWARIEDGTVAQAGPQCVWDVVEAAHRRWDELGRPTRDKFGIDVAPGVQQVRLDGSDATWRLPAMP
ncbi:hypothetical protein ACIA49_37310 [Kribbella sp. NPDC051587]|uniref:hypothetical protein n=1 Tax=Kribbella sp. NPDC051587 TaxID=3364119 RepID=UPI003791FD62